MSKDNGTQAWDNAFGDMGKNSIPPIEKHFFESCGKVLQANKWGPGNVKYLLTCVNLRCRKSHHPQGYILDDGRYLRSRFVAPPEGITIEGITVGGTPDGTGKSQ
jgi:hypothetical protein